MPPEMSFPMDTHHCRPQTVGVWMFMEQSAIAADYQPGILIPPTFVPVGLSLATDRSLAWTGVTK